MNMLSIAAEIFEDIGEEKRKTLYSNMVNMLINKALKDEYADLLLQIIEDARAKECKDEEET
jgi:Mg/Co/Ni transporter MgtE